MYAARDGSPLVLGHGTDELPPASDVPVFLEFTDRVTYLEDGDAVVAESDTVRVTDLDGVGGPEGRFWVRSRPGPPEPFPDAPADPVVPVSHDDHLVDARALRTVCDSGPASCSRGRQ